MWAMTWNEFYELTQWFFAAGLGLSAALVISTGIYSAARKVIRRR